MNRIRYYLAILLLPLALQLHAQQELTLKLRQFEQTGARRLPGSDSAFLALKAAYNRAMEQREITTAAHCLQQMGRRCYHLGHYPQSLDFHLQAGELFRQTGSMEALAANLDDVGILYYYNRQPALARQQYEEALSIYTRLQNKAGMAATYGKIGHLYEKQQQYDSAFYFQQQALARYLQIDNQQGMAKIYENMGSIYEDLARYDSAGYYFQKALQLNEAIGDDTARIEVLNNLGDVLRKTGRYREGLQQTLKALALARRVNEQYQLSGAYRDVAKSYNLLGNNDSAYHYLELSRTHLLDIYSEESSKQVALLQTMFDMEKKNREIERLTNARKMTRIITVAVLIVILLLIVLSTVIISRQRLKIRHAKMLAEQDKQQYESQKERMQTELEHRKMELSAHTLHIIQKNQLLEELQQRLNDMVKDERRDQKKQLKQLQQQINHSFNHDHYWEEFRNMFEQVHHAFFNDLKKYCDKLTPADLRLVALLKMNLPSGDIATLLSVSQDSLRVMRYRLRKKLNIVQGESLTTFIQSL
jgi:tetratricopeptide (TPR) repeat protein